jgi:hypothetical protein
LSSALSWQNLKKLNDDRRLVGRNKRRYYRVNSAFDTLPASGFETDIPEMPYAQGDVDIQSACGHVQSAVD